MATSNSDKAVSASRRTIYIPKISLAWHVRKNFLPATLTLSLPLFLPLLLVYMMNVFSISLFRYNHKKCSFPPTAMLLVYRVTVNVAGFLPLLHPYFTQRCRHSLPLLLYPCPSFNVDGFCRCRHTAAAVACANKNGLLPFFLLYPKLELGVFLHHSTKVLLFLPGFINSLSLKALISVRREREGVMFCAAFLYSKSWCDLVLVAFGCICFILHYILHD